jgi:tetratricopeptide (TPR) repeat protein
LEAVAACVEFAARERPVALVIEDAHAADAPSLELIAYVGRRLARLPILLAVTRRELPRRPDVDAVEHELRARGTMAGELLLDPLESDAVATLARSVAALEPDDVDAVVGHADGNALLAVETARAVARGESGPAASLRGAVRAAFRSLPSPGRRVAELAAVAARPLERLELRTLGIAEPAAAASQALDTGVMTSASGGVGYRHALLRDAAYADLAEPRRAELHEQLANALAEADPSRAGEAARHFRLAGRDDLAVDQLVRAAEHARSVTALDQAAELLAEAIEIVGEEPELLLEMGELEAWLGRREAAEAAFDRALPALERRGGLPLADAWLQRGRWYHGPICHPRLVREVSQEALRVLDALPGDHSERRQEATAAIAWVEAVDGDVDRAEELIAGLANAPRESAEFAISDYDLGHARALALVRRGRFEDAYEPSILAGRAADRCGRPDLSYGCWMNAAGAAAAIGDHERALEFLDQTMRSVGGRGMLSAEIQALAARAAVLTRLGRLQEAKAVTEQQREIADRTGHPQLIATAAHDRAMVALATGDYECAERLIKEALDGGATVSRPIARLTRAEALARLGRCDEAEEEIRATALEPVRPADFPETLVPRMTRVQGLVAAARGDDDLAARRLEEAADGWRRSGRGRPGDRMATVLTDFGRPVLGAVDTGWELDRVLADIEAIRTPA